MNSCDACWFVQCSGTRLGGDQPFCSLYIDDILVFPPTVEEHIDHLKQIFSR